MEPIGHLTNENYVFNYDLSSAPRHKKCIILTSGGIAMLGQITGNLDKDKDVWAWSPMPKRDKKKEQSLGLTTLPADYTASLSESRTEITAAQPVTESKENEGNIPIDPYGICSHAIVCDSREPGDVLQEQSNQLSEVRQSSFSATFVTAPNTELDYRVKLEFDSIGDNQFHLRCESEPGPATATDSSTDQ